MIENLKLQYLKLFHISRHVCNCNKLCRLMMYFNRVHNIQFFYTFGCYDETFYLPRWLYGKPTGINALTPYKIPTYNIDGKFPICVFNLNDIEHQLSYFEEILKKRDISIPRIYDVLIEDAVNQIKLKKKDLNDDYLWDKYSITIDKSDDTWVKYLIHKLDIRPNYYWGSSYSEPQNIYMGVYEKRSPYIINDITITCNKSQDIQSVVIKGKHPNCDENNEYCMGDMIYNTKFDMTALKIIISSLSTHNLRKGEYYEFPTHLSRGIYG